MTETRINELSKIFRETFERNPQRTSDPALALESAREAVCAAAREDEEFSFDDETLTVVPRFGETMYYHAGVGTEDGITWSQLTHETLEAAESEARDMAELSGTRGVVEYWSRDHGPEPGDCEVICGADWL